MARELTHSLADSGQLVGFVTCPSREVAEALAQELVESEAVACVNILGGVTSVYRWQGEVCKDQEYLLVVKTDRTRTSRVTQKLAQIHPYEEPELIFLPIESGSQSYLAWMTATS